MDKNLKSKKRYSLPETESRANQIYYGLMLSGFLSIFMLLATYRKYIQPTVNIELKESFIIFSVLHGLALVVGVNCAVAASKKIRQKLKKTMQENFSSVVVAASRSEDEEVVRLGSKYWFWQLIGGYLTGTTYSWFVCLFIIFII